MIKEIRIKKTINKDVYPLNIQAIQSIESLVLDKPATIFVGDNGSGKSTLLQAIAKQHGAINTSGKSLSDPYYDALTPLSDNIKLIYSVKNNHGFLFSSEHFITYIHKLQEEKADLEAYIKEVEENYKDKSDFARNQALSPAKKELYAIKHTYEGELQEKSHGEGFLSFFKARMHQKGIYFLDEPESPLSPFHQYQLLVLLSDLIQNGSQIIMATHSPILMALSGATIYEFSDSIKKVSHDDVESVKFMTYFLNHKETFLERIKKK